MINHSRLFCSSKMMNYYKKEVKTNYFKIDPLKIEKVQNGIVHPIQSSNLNYINQKYDIYGGVTDNKLKIIELSLNKMISPNFNNKKTTHIWYKGPSPYCKVSDINFINEDVIFLGALHKHYGHFILEGLSRLWFCLRIRKQNYKFVYISTDGKDRFLDFFKIFGIEKSSLKKITKPTQFKSVTIPEPSIRLHDYCHLEYKKTIDKIKDNVKKSRIDKVYFSKENIKNNRAFNEKSIRKVFSKNGFEVFYPEQLNAYKMISILKGCKILAGTSATNMHNSIFMDDKKSFICLNRSAHFHPIQTMIEKMKSLKATYVDVFYFSSNKNFGDQPCLLTPTKYLLNFFVFFKFKFNSIKLYLSFISCFLKFFSIVQIKYLLMNKLYHYLVNKKLIRKILGKEKNK